MTIKDFTESKKFRVIIWVIVGFLAALFIFQAGIFVGFRRASFSFSAGDNYYRTFGAGPDGSPDFPNSHGVSGKIIKISLPMILVASDDGVEKSILVGSSTPVRQFRQMLSPSDLKVDDTVIIIGSPNSNSQIEAKLIRIIP